MTNGKKASLVFKEAATAWCMTRERVLCMIDELEAVLSDIAGRSRRKMALVKAKRILVQEVGWLLCDERDRFARAALEEAEEREGHG